MTLRERLNDLEQFVKRAAERPCAFKDHPAFANAKEEDCLERCPNLPVEFLCVRCQALALLSTAPAVRPAPNTTPPEERTR